MALQQNYGTGRRKSSTARVFLRKGSGKITVNDRPLDEFFGRYEKAVAASQPRVCTNGVPSPSMISGPRIPLTRSMTTAVFPGCVRGEQRRRTVACVTTPSHDRW